MLGTAAIPWLIGRVIDEIDAGNKSGLETLCALLVVAGLVRLVFSVARRIVSGKVSLGVEYDLRNGLYGHLQALELGFFDRQQTGQLMSRATVDLQSIRFFLGYGFVWIAQSALTILFAAIAMFAKDPGLAALSLAPVPFVVAVAFRYGRRSRPALQEVQQRVAELTAEAEENVSGVRVVKAFAAEPRQLERFRGAVHRVFDQAMFATRLSAFYQPFIGFLPQLGLAAILIVGGRQVINGTLTAGDFAAFYTYLLMLISPMRSLGIALGFGQRATASGVRLFQILDREPRIASPELAPPLPVGNGRVELRDVSFNYEDGSPVLRHVDLAVDGGTTVALAGATGAGKSTLISLLGRNYDVTGGQVLVDGADVREVELNSLRSQIGVVTDDPFLFSATVHDNIAYGRPDATRDEVVRAAERAQAAGFIEALPRGLRHRGRRTRPHAVGRPAPADRDRAGARHRPADPDPRRRDLLGRRLDRAGDQAGAARGDARPHHLRDRPPAVHARARRRHRRARGRRDRGARHPRRTAAPERAVRRDRREGAARPGLPQPQPDRAGGRPVSGAQQTETHERLADLRRRWRATSGRGRKLRGLAELLRPYRGRVILAMIALVFATAASLAPPPLAKFAIDEGITPKDLGKLNLAVVLFLVSALVYWGASYAQTYLVGWVGQRALQDLRIQLFAHLQTLSVGFYSRRSAGAIISRLTNDVQALDQLVSDGVVTLFGSTLTLLGTAAILFWLDAQLALLTLVIFPVLGIASFAFRIISADAYRITREKIAAITGYLQETLSGIRVVRAFAQEPRHKQVFADLNDENRKANMTTVYLNAAYFPGVELLSALVTAGILLYGGIQAIQGDVTIGVLVAFVAALNNFFDPIQQLSQLYTTYQAGMAALDKIFELLDQEPDILDGELELASLRGEIEFDDVIFSYGSEDTGDALCHITLHVPPGQTVALVGATGAGKSTLAKLVARFYDPTSGRILVDGHDLREVSASSLRSQMGIVPQEAFLFSGTIGENIAFGRPDATPEEVEQAARAVGADEFVAALERGYDTEVGERGAQLSAGQRQLVAFARALIADPRILVLDEATSNVDIHTESRIEAGLRRLLGGRTAIVIAHRLSTIQRAGRIVVLDHGRIVEQGTHEELLDAQGAYFKLYRDWAEQAAA